MSWGTSVLPSAGLMSVWHTVAWGVVLAWGVSALVPASLITRWPLLHRAAVGLMLLWCAAPGVYSPDHWLGLAFQAPSISTVVLCAVLLWRSPLAVAGTAADVEARTPGLDTLAAAGVLLGWLLLLDTFALLPVELYAWGFSPLSAAVCLLLACLPWVWMGSPGPHQRGWLVPGAALVVVAVFVALRLPSGNLWDALLDPGLWVVLQVGVVRRWLGR